MLDNYACDDATHMPRWHKGDDVIGIELEVEGKESQSCAERYIRDIDGFADDYVCLKRDGSLGPHGVEIVTRPDHIEEHKRKWSRFFDNKPSRSLRSWDTRRCGMHVHVNRDWLTPLQTAKAVVFTNEPHNMHLLQSVAGRYQSKWCSYSKKKLAKNYPGPRGQPDWLNRRTAVNTLGEYTIEFRIFRGTLARDGFFKNLEFVLAVLDFCKPAARSIADAQSYRKFLGHIQENRREYPLLYKFLCDKDFIPKPKKRKQD